MSGMPIRYLIARIAVHSQEPATVDGVPLKLLLRIDERYSMESTFSVR